MKPRSLLGTIALTVSVGAASLEIAKGIINTFSYDIFDRCLKNENGDLFESYCTQGPQTFIAVIAGVVFFLLGTYVLIRVSGLIQHKRMLLLLALLLVVILSMTWRIRNQLADNFTLTGGPDNFFEYLYVSYYWLESVVAGSIVGLAAWLANNTTANAKQRTEPRITFLKK